MKYDGNGLNKKTVKRMAMICQSISFILVMVLFSSVGDFVTTITSHEDVYELRYEAEETLENDQLLCRLYRNGEYMDDVDSNRYTLLDSSGKTDIRYCALTEDAGNLTFFIILSAMLFLVIRIVGSTAERTPFTRANVRRIRIISLLQLALAVVPGSVRMIMTLCRFDYVTVTLELGGLYMFVIAFVIAMIAWVFDYGVKLQEDSDSIA